jgi:hypothetical protein
MIVAIMAIMAAFDSLETIGSRGVWCGPRGAVCGAVAGQVTSVAGQVPMTAVAGQEGRATIQENSNSKFKVCSSKIVIFGARYMPKM